MTRILIGLHDALASKQPSQANYALSILFSNCGRAVKEYYGRMDEIRIHAGKLYYRDAWLSG